MDNHRMLQLYTYFRSSASYRVRIALHLKGLPFESVPVHLLKDGGAQHAPAYQHINPAKLVPALIDDGHAVTQSMAIMEYLDETHPDQPLMPRDALGRARVRALAQAIACEIHPLNNLRVGEGETGRVIGREGKVANAMRVLVRIAGEKTGERRANLEIV